MQKAQIAFRPPHVKSKPASSRAELFTLLVTDPLYSKRGVNDAELHLECLGFGRDDLPALRGKRFLDLGCGTRDCPDSINALYALSAPWISRYLYGAGAAVVGIDIRAQVRENFMSYQIDLSKLGALSFIPDKSFDIIICNGLIDFSNPASGSTSPSLKKKGNGEKRSLRELQDIVEELKGQMHRILEIGGKVLNDFDYGKPNILKNMSYGLVQINWSW